MKCPYCGNDDEEVVAGRYYPDHYRRYRKCHVCGRNFITKEYIVGVNKGLNAKKYFCDYCGRELDGWFLTYKDKHFCRFGNDRCIKEYLYEEHDAEILEERGNGEVAYDMSKVAEHDGE